MSIKHADFILGDKLCDGGDFKKAFDLFLRQAKKGDVYCMERVASMYSDGEGVQKDFDQSIDWDLRAIDKGSDLSKLNLAITYRIIGEIQKYKFWLEESLKSGDKEAALLLAKLYMITDKEMNKVIAYLDIVISSDDVFPTSLEEAIELRKVF